MSAYCPTPEELAICRWGLELPRGWNPIDPQAITEADEQAIYHLITAHDLVGKFTISIELPETRIIHPTFQITGTTRDIATPLKPHVDHLLNELGYTARPFTVPSLPTHVRLTSKGEEKQAQFLEASMGGGPKPPAPYVCLQQWERRRQANRAAYLIIGWTRIPHPEIIIDPPAPAPLLAPVEVPVWSLPMNKDKIAGELGLTRKQLNSATLAGAYQLDKINHQLFRLRIDQLPQDIRQRFTRPNNGQVRPTVAKSARN